ncbi:response regulator [Abyssibacter profundi]|uniref:DNA-binding response regulator n=1 Tax=Abyssibacter profundi TaxID=2182787 RepID=A0A363UMN6_9GAMM|nr:response regulator transcription factor [Abyssibacter profundi]PWN56670.1 DNA-binding response regulator [Abyssibacter profundi]
MSIRVALIDDQTLVRQGIRGLLELSDRVTVVAEADDGDQALRVVTEARPDVLLMDMRMPRMDGAQATAALAAAGESVPVIILTTFDDHEQVLAGIRAGAKGYLLKDVSLDNLILAIESVTAGQTMIQPAITEALLRGLARQPEGGFAASDMPEPLTARETEVLRLMAGGYSNKEIAQALSKSDGTVKNHVSHILAKLGVRDRTRAVLKAIELNLI